MIYTVTLNPALDIVFYGDENIDTNAYNKTHQTQKFPGGKAINVSRTLYNLGIPSLATGFLGGYSGRFISDWFNERAIETMFIKIDEDTRTNVRVKTEKEQMTIAGIYPNISKEQLDSLLYFLSRVREGDIVVMGGSIPSGVDSDIYKRITDICISNNAYFVVDIPPKQTLQALKDKPLLIKPNIDNLALMFDKMDGFVDEDDIIEHGLKCIHMGAKNAIVSIGKDGSYLFTEDESVYRSYGVSGKEVNSFNSRDAMIGGFIGLYMKKADPVEAFKMASAAASATAFVEDLGTREEIEEVFKKTVIEKIR